MKSKFLNKNLCLYFALFALFFISCTNKELTKEKAMPLIASYYGLNDTNSVPSRQTQIAIDKKIDNYGWPPEKYKQLQQQGIISINFETGGLLYNRIVATVTENGNKYLQGTRILQTQTDGNKEQYMFKGYKFSIINISISSNAKEKNAEAVVNFVISDITPIQQIFSPVKKTELNSTVYFKLYDDGWKIVDNAQSYLPINLIDNPLHWAGN